MEVTGWLMVTSPAVEAVTVTSWDVVQSPEVNVSLHGSAAQVTATLPPLLLVAVGVMTTLVVGAAPRSATW